MSRGENRCDYVIRRAGETYDGKPLMMDGHGDKTQTCGKFGRKVPHTYRVRRPGTTAVYDAFEGTVVRCPEHEAS
jgi:hypothetical protein